MKRIEIICVYLDLKEGCMYEKFGKIKGARKEDCLYKPLKEEGVCVYYEETNK